LMASSASLATPGNLSYRVAISWREFANATSDKTRYAKVHILC
jgi:hypothetical protein